MFRVALTLVLTIGLIGCNQTEAITDDQLREIFAEIPTLGGPAAVNQNIAECVGLVAGHVDVPSPIDEHSQELTNDCQAAIEAFLADPSRNPSGFQLQDLSSKEVHARLLIIAAEDRQRRHARVNRATEEEPTQPEIAATKPLATSPRAEREAQIGQALAKWPAGARITQGDDFKKVAGYYRQDGRPEQFLICLTSRLQGADDTDCEELIAARVSLAGPNPFYSRHRTRDYTQAEILSQAFYWQLFEAIHGAE